MKKIALASDHAGFETKQALIPFLESKGFKIIDYGCFSTDSCDYPDFAHPMALAVENHTADLGISLCGSGNGINMVANKHQQIRSALCWNPEIAKLAIEHNQANVCAIPARFVSLDEAKAIVDAFLSAEFEGGRHIRRIDKIPVK
jgi:ribose 5-phosphate isomerase B